MAAFILIALGLCFGSFINALIWRLHQRESGKKKPLKGTTDLSIVSGRSICPNCKHQLAAKDLIPIFSWFWLKGRCRYCKKPISLQYPVVEALTALLFGLSYLFWPQAFTLQVAFDFIIWLVFLTGLIAIAVYDIRWMLIPNRILYPLLWLAAIQIVAKIAFFNLGPRLIMDSALSLLIAGGLFYVLFQLSKGKWIGGGDVKLGFLLGLILANPFFSLLMIFVASLVGLVVSLPLLATKRLNLKARVPFGPMLIVAAIIVKFFGQALVEWYQRQFLSL